MSGRAGARRVQGARPSAAPAIAVRNVEPAAECVILGGWGRPLALAAPTAAVGPIDRSTSLQRFGDGVVTEQREPRVDWLASGALLSVTRAVTHVFRVRRTSWWIGLLLLLVACAPPDAPEPGDADGADGGAVDAAVAHDAAPVVDAGLSADAAVEAPLDAAAPDGRVEVMVDAGRSDARIDPCLGVRCPGSACRLGACDPRSGECGLGAPRGDGVACDDGSACTAGDRCAGGACVAGAPIVCPPTDACHTAGVCDPATGTCSSAPRPCTTEVLVRVRDARGGMLPTPSIVRAFVGATAQPQGGITDAMGDIRLSLPGGSYRFRATRDGLPYWSGASDHCTMPSCTSVELRVPDTTPERAVSWDPMMDGAYDGRGEISPLDPHIERNGTYLENWAIERYGAPDAFVSAGHTHIYPQSWDPPDTWGNPTEYENQHAFGDTLQGVFVRLDDRRPFDLVSIDYRPRSDADPEHVSTIVGADPADVAIWISESLAVPTTPWRSYSTGKPFNVALGHWSTVFPTDFTNVTGVFITTTGNVSIDNVVVRPR